MVSGTDLIWIKPALEPCWVGKIDGITRHISVHVKPVAIADGIGLQKPSEHGIIGARLELVKLKLFKPDLPRETEPRNATERRGAGFLDNKP